MADSALQFAVAFTGYIWKKCCRHWTSGFAQGYADCIFLKTAVAFALEFSDCCLEFCFLL